MITLLHPLCLFLLSPLISSLSIIWGVTTTTTNNDDFKNKNKSEFLERIRESKEMDRLEAKSMRVDSTAITIDNTSSRPTTSYQTLLNKYYSLNGLFYFLNLSKKTDEEYEQFKQDIIRLVDIPEDDGLDGKYQGIRINCVCVFSPFSFLLMFLFGFLFNDSKMSFNTYMFYQLIVYMGFFLTVYG